VSKEKLPQYLRDDAGLRLRGFSGKRLEKRSGVKGLNSEEHYKALFVSEEINFTDADQTKDSL